jgi:hypothetical protein
MITLEPKSLTCKALDDVEDQLPAVRIAESPRRFLARSEVIINILNIHGLLHQ